MKSSVSGEHREYKKVVIPFLALGTAAILFGGVYSAAIARSTSYTSAWFVAYLVLIVGLAQVVLGVGQWWLSAKPISTRTLIAQLVFFNLGNLGVIVGTWLATPIWVYAGSVCIVIALGLFTWQVRSPRHTGVSRWGYLVLQVLLFVSVLIGVYFASSASR